MTNSTRTTTSGRVPKVTPRRVQGWWAEGPATFEQVYDRFVELERTLCYAASELVSARPKLRRLTVKSGSALSGVDGFIDEMMNHIGGALEDVEALAAWYQNIPEGQEPGCVATAEVRR